MKVLSISTDRKVFEKGSAVRARLVEYGQLADELHVIVFAKHSLKLKDEKIAPNVFIYSTNSLSRFFHIWAAIARAKKLKQNGLSIDLVTTQDPFETGLAGYKIARMFGARLHVQIHTDFMSRFFARESFLNSKRVNIAKFVLKRANSVRTVSDRIKKSIGKLVRCEVPITVIPIFVKKQSDEKVLPTNNLKEKYPQFDFYALVASRLAPEKNIDSVVCAMDTIVKTKPKAGLIIVGEGPEKQHLEKLVARLALTKNVIFEGWQDNLFSYYKTADVFVLPSLYEGYGMTAVEAALAGCPVVMTDVGCAGDVIVDSKNGLIVPVDDTKALISALLRVISGEVKFNPKTLSVSTIDEYLATYKKSWQDALH